jgi:hypothetical protein
MKVRMPIFLLIHSMQGSLFFNSIKYRLCVTIHIIKKLVKIKKNSHFCYSLLGKMLYNK